MYVRGFTQLLELGEIISDGKIDSAFSLATGIRYFLVKSLDIRQHFPFFLSSFITFFFAGLKLSPAPSHTLPSLVRLREFSHTKYSLFENISTCFFLFPLLLFSLPSRLFYLLLVSPSSSLTLILSESFTAA